VNLTLTPSGHLMMIGSGEKIAQAFADSQAAGIMALAGARRDLSGNDPTLEETGWAFVEAGDRLRDMLAGLRVIGKQCSLGLLTPRSCVSNN
jgi:hypothetical protein